jgi:hypothetical protein
MIQAQATVLSRSEFDSTDFDPLWRGTAGTIRGEVRGAPFTASVIIPQYGARIAQHYRDIAPRGLSEVAVRADIPFSLEQFGLRIVFERPCDLALHDDDMNLDDSVRRLVGRFGPVIFRNACVAGSARQRFHRNIFPHLRFHTDRGRGMPNRYSCFTRDPLDPEQREPRLSSTLFAANIVTWLQAVREGQCDPAIDRGTRMSIDLFADADLSAALGKVVLEQPWDAPAGTGEIAVIDNADVLHATCHRHSDKKGYPIGARYLC